MYKPPNYSVQEPFLESLLAGKAIGQVVEKINVYLGKATMDAAEGWWKWFKANPNEVVKALAETGNELPEDVREMTEEAIENSQLATASQEVKTAVLDFVTAIPGSVRRSLLQDRNGVVSLSRTVKLDNAESLLQLFPTDIPPYRAPCQVPGTGY